MKFYYRIFVRERGAYSGHPSPLAPDFIEFESPWREKQTAVAIWCNLMEEHLAYFRKCEENGTLVSMVVYKGNLDDQYGVKKVYCITNLNIENINSKAITLNDIDY